MTTTLTHKPIHVDMARLLVEKHDTGSGTLRPAVLAALTVANEAHASSIRKGHTARRADWFKTCSVLSECMRQLGRPEYLAGEMGALRILCPDSATRIPYFKARFGR